VYGQGVRNLNDGISLLNIADGTLGVVSSTVDRLKELAEQAANGTYSTTQRVALQREADQLVGEFNRQLGATSFNDRALLNGLFGNLAIQAGSGTGAVVQSNVGGLLQRSIGDRTFTDGTRIDTGSTSISDMESADVNGDGLDDLVVLDNGTTLSVYLQQSDGTFGTATSTATNGTMLALGDFDGDGRIDFAVGKSTGALTIHTGNGSGGASSGSSLTVGTAITDLQVADLNGDGRSDLGALTSSSVVGFYNSGSALSAPATTLLSYSGGGTLSAFKLADVTGDGAADIITGSSTGVISSYARGTTGAYSLGGAHTRAGGLEISAIQVGDLNRDGNVDIVAVGQNHLTSLAGNGAGGVSFIATGGNKGKELHLADVNGDGLLDAVGSFDGSIVISFGNLDGTFTASSEAPSTAYEGAVSRVVIGDYNRDGILDVISSSGTKIGFQYGNSTTTTTAQYVTLTTQSGAQSALSTLESLAQRIANERGRIGAMQSRLEVAANVLQSARDNFIAAASRITDADVGLETSELVRQQILQKSGAAVLAQANQEPSLVLKLLAA
jgi:flagellin